MRHESQRTEPTDPDMALLFFGSLLSTLQHAPERDDVMLDALATQIILDRSPKTLLGLAITACAEKWLRRRLWMADFESLPPSDQAVRLVTDSAMRIEGSHSHFTVQVPISCRHVVSRHRPGRVHRAAPPDEGTKTADRR